MRYLSIVAVLACICGCSIAQTGVSLSDDMQPGQIKTVMTQVADWQIANPSKHAVTDWTHGALFAGMSAWAQMADNDKYLDALVGFGNKTNWQLGPRAYHADDHAVGQMYIEMYNIYKDPKMLAGVQGRFDWILDHQSNTSLDIRVKGSHDRYWWCDALFMGPPTWAKLATVVGDKKYLDFMNKEWWATTDYLFDKEENLYFRDSNYFGKKEKNGEKVFWSRGNGWVFGGLARVIDQLPCDYPEKEKYIDLYKKMAKKIIAIQPEEGLWHSSLLDPVYFPSKEASGSGFYCFGLAWGINNGLLDEETYLPAVIKAWEGLVGCVHDDGMLGFVQPIGADPRHVNAEQTEIYGVGSFLLAGSEVYKIAVRNHQDVKVVTVSNPKPFFRNSETISIDEKAGEYVYDLQSNKLLRTQVLNGKMLFQTDLGPGQTKKFWLMDKPNGVSVPESKVSTHCVFIPERKDDFGWESDKAAYRMYGPALEYETITCGIDAWGKSVPEPIIDRYIREYVEKHIPYHNGHDDGGDFYKVGNTLGCGAMAPFVNGKVCLSNHNFYEWKILANGPIRSVFEMKYKPWDAGGLGISETKIISIDLGSNLSRVECYYACDKDVSFEAAAGIILRDVSDAIWAESNVIGYWIPADYKEKGNLGCGVVFDKNYKTKIMQADGHLLLTTANSSVRPIVYYSGSCWDKNEEFNNFDKWKRYLKNFKMRLDNPVSVSIAE